MRRRVRARSGGQEPCISWRGPSWRPCHVACGPVVRMWRAHRQQHRLEIHQDESIGQSSLSTTSSGLDTASGLSNTARLASATLTHRTHSFTQHSAIASTAPLQARPASSSAVVRAVSCRPRPQVLHDNPHRLAAVHPLRPPASSTTHKTLTCEARHGTATVMGEQHCASAPFFRVSSTRCPMMAADNTFPPPARPPNGVSTTARFTSQHPKCRSIVNQL